jgi:hypothetical protein
MTAETKFDPSHVNVRIKISALWTSMLFVFAYVDLFTSIDRISGPTSRLAKSAGLPSTSRSSWGPPSTSSSPV